MNLTYFVYSQMTTDKSVGMRGNTSMSQTGRQQKHTHVSKERERVFKEPLVEFLFCHYNRGNIFMESADNKYAKKKQTNDNSSQL